MSCINLLQRRYPLVEDLELLAFSLARVTIKPRRKYHPVKKSIYIISTAKCTYYFSKMDLTQPPPLHPGFYRRAKTLKRNSSKCKLPEFARYYGTHFTTSVTFGAKFTKQHSMSSQSYKTASSRNISFCSSKLFRAGQRQWRI